MKHELKAQFDEPVGIVISRGSSQVSSPRFIAYVWAPAPDDDKQPDVQAA